MSGTRVALLIATDAYADPAFGQLRAPQHDVEELARVLRDPQIGDYHVDVLINAPSQQIRIRINRLFHQARRDDLVLLYLSGHGLKDEAGHLHLASTDTERGLLASTAVPGQWIREIIDHSPVRQVVVWLDCCYGGAFPPGMIPKNAGRVDVVPQLAAGRGCVVMTASTHIQFAFEPSGHLTHTTQASVFTSAIVDGLRTGDADRNADGHIDTDELYSYVHDRVTASTPNQTPTRNQQVSGEIIVAHSKRGLPLDPALPTEIKHLLRSNNPEYQRDGVDLLCRMANNGKPAEQIQACNTLNKLLISSNTPLAQAVAEKWPDRQLAAAAPPASRPQPLMVPPRTPPRSVPSAPAETSEPPHALETPHTLEHNQPEQLPKPSAPTPAGSRPPTARRGQLQPPRPQQKPTGPSHIPNEPRTTPPQTRAAPATPLPQVPTAQTASTPANHPYQVGEWQDFPPVIGWFVLLCVTLPVIVLAVIAFPQSQADLPGVWVWRLAIGPLFTLVGIWCARRLARSIGKFLAQRRRFHAGRL